MCLLAGRTGEFRQGRGRKTGAKVVARGLQGSWRWRWATPDGTRGLVERIRWVARKQLVAGNKDTQVLEMDQAQLGCLMKMQRK